MIAFVIFCVLLVFSVLLSARFKRTLLSAAVLFLLGGIVTGEGALGFAHVSAEAPLVSGMTRAALVAVLFTDAMGANLQELRRAWRLPGRALLFGMPLTMLGLALLSHLLLQVPWRESFLLGAILSPTDPVLSNAIVGRAAVPLQLRSLLNVESGVNDGIALPVVVALLPEAHAAGWTLLAEVAGGVVVGVAVAWCVLALRSLSFFEVHEPFAPLVALTIGLTTFAVATVLHVSEFLAAFAAGITVATLDARTRTDFEPLGELLVSLLKVGTIFLFGLAVSARVLASFQLLTLLYALLAIIVVRPLSIFVALVGSALELPLRAVAAWFGPKGFASILFGLFILHGGHDVSAGAASAENLFRIIGLVVVCSILAHSTTDVPIAHWLERRARG